MASEVALEDAGRVACAFAFADAPSDVVAGRGVVLAAVEDDGVEGAVVLAVAAAAEPVADRLTARGYGRQTGVAVHARTIHCEGTNAV